MNPLSSFYERVSDDFDRNSYFLLIEVQSTKTRGFYIVENDDLYYFLRKTQTIDKEAYKKMIQHNLKNKTPFQFGDSLPEDMFIRVKPVNSVDRNAAKGKPSFLATYFDGIVLKDGIQSEERTAIIQKLFEWKIASKIDDESGYLIISER